MNSPHCFHCGSPVKAGAAFCTSCGARMKAADAEPSEPAAKGTGSPPRLKPLSTGEVFDVSFRLLGRNWKRLAVASLILYAMFFIPVLILMALGALLMAQSRFVPALFFYFAFLTVGSMAFQSAYVGVLIQLCSNLHLGTPYRFSESAKESLQRAVPFCGLSICYVLCFLAGCAACIAPGVYLASRWSVVFQTFFLEGKGVMESFRRSWTLTENHVLRSFLILVCVMGISMMGQSLINAPMQAAVGFLGVSPKAMIPLMAAQFLAAMILNFVVPPLMFLILTVHYYDLRVKREGLDLELAAEA